MGFMECIERKDISGLHLLKEIEITIQNIKNSSRRVIGSICLSVTLKKVLGADLADVNDSKN